MTTSEKRLVVASYGDDSVQMGVHFKRKQSPFDTVANSFFDAQVSNTYVQTFTAYVGFKTKKKAEPENEQSDVCNIISIH